MSKRSASTDNEPNIPTKKPLLEDNRVVIHESTLSLQNLASIKVAICLWGHRNIRHLCKEIGSEENNSDVTEYELDEYFDLSTLSSHVEKKLKELPVPQPIQRLISKYMWSISSELKRWIDYQHKRIFFHHKSNNIVFYYLDEVIWKSNCEIDYLETARNMLTSLKVSEIEKYRLISTYCIEDEIKNVSPLAFNRKYRTKVPFEDHPLLYYWKFYAMGRLDKLKGTFSSAENRVVTMQGVDNLHAIRYFWDRMNENEQVQMAAFLIHRDGLKYQKYFLPLMTELQQHSIFVDMAVEIILNFAKDSSFSGYVITTWMHIRNFVTESQFVGIFTGIVCTVGIFDRSSYNMSSLIEIWQSSPNHLKKFAIEYNNREIIYSLTKSYSLNGFTAKLLYEILHDASPQLREHVFMNPPYQYSHEFYRYLIGRGKPSLLEDFLELCCPNENVIAVLKGRIIEAPETKNYCYQLFVEGDMKTLDEFLAIYLPTERIPDFRVQLFMSQKSIEACAQRFQPLRFAGLFKTIAHILPDEQAALDFKRKCIFSNPCLAEFKFLIPRGLLCDVIHCVERLLTSEDDRKAVKENLKQHYLNKPIWKIFENFQVNYWQEFLIWCMDGKENVLKYKLSFPFEETFAEMLQQSTFQKYDILLKNCKFKYGCYFDDLDRFLYWYFETSDEVKKFKISRIFEYDKVNMINTLLKKKNDAFLCQVLQWFFDGDKEQMLKFKTQFPGSKISSLL